ncbi:dUTP diphosphatase [Alicyclobacillus shizuokensis]|uniref:dUTP diphosphatase n=1 Tax=Alicyclobacillus shizuokensis TaxID=392014 RepID=UPI000835EC35|nr:dUTP diphosphatase [Alicyclobacillus shizuokensis]MCL6626898.1 dUTP diphosphatase [Alicyclobacillus shizuokensis]
MADIHVKYRVVSPHFRPEYLPEYATAGAAGMDLHACLPTAITVAPGERVKVPTGIAIQILNPYTVALVYARSGLAFRHGLALPNGVGVIDSDYTGEVMVLLMNFGAEAVTIEPGDRVAQMVFAPVHRAVLEATDAFVRTDRGEGGFGSTGIRP